MLLTFDSDYKALERALAQCLQTFFEVFREHRDDADDESQEVLDAFLKELVDRLSPHGLSALKTIELKVNPFERSAANEKVPLLCSR